MRVLKFGGTSVATPERIRDVTRIIINAAKEEATIVVVSAFQGVSSQLLLCGNMAASGDINYLAIYEELTERHFNAIDTLFAKKNHPIKITIQQMLLELNEILQGIFLLKELTLGAQDNIASFGERLSACILANYINQEYPSEYVDARRLILTDNNHTQAAVIYEKTNDAIRRYYDEILLKGPLIPVITGYIGSTIDGRTTTLGRNSSDYSAVIIGAALDATQIEIWTDVDGIYSADPQLVPSAFVVQHISYAEAIELSYFGAKVIHPSMFIPVFEKQIPILIKNTLNPHCAGTLIEHQHSKKAPKKIAAKSISVIDDITLLIWQGNGTADVSSTIERLFKCLTLGHINIFLILEASPKHTICLAISHKEIEKARNAIQQEFYFEMHHQLFRIDEKPSQSIIAIIGDDIKKLSPEVAGKMFQSLGKMQVNVNAIVQGASERNFSLVIDAHHRTRALNLIHQAFFAKSKCLSLILIGVGQVGTKLLEQLHEQMRELKAKKYRVSVCAIANSQKMLVNTQGIDLDHWSAELARSTESFDIVALLKTLSHIECSNIALLDCTASDDIVKAYPMFIQEGVHIVTPNKRANTLPYSEYLTLMAQFKHYQCHFLCTSNVGAGLPVITVLRDLIACGDTVIKIEGILSGTLSYLFNHYDGSLTFSKVLQQTQILGMTEPDPREDLSGLDVARKLLILARILGLKMELSDVSIENLVPEALRFGKFTDQFYKDYERYEDYFKQRLLQCHSNDTVLRYVGTLQNGQASARLEEIPLDHPLALACYSDNIISFQTHRYHEMPLVIRGPGAGVEVTAMGVFSDILKLLSYLPE
ncbi:MAG: bifunctional aspartate kinase/homoserine dehydrogenase I [Gammaproteobacteria bacterium]|nr:bifunctional aspartate kinase/homoserine dehydrogenase I [Gammaproteobacteria bacterium]